MKNMPREKGSQVDDSDTNYDVEQFEAKQLEGEVEASEQDEDVSDPVTTLAEVDPDPAEVNSETRGDGSTAYFSQGEDAREKASGGYAREHGTTI